MTFDHMLPTPLQAAGTEHPAPRLIRAYTRGEVLDHVVDWALEAHLESCATCREVQAGSMAPAAKGMAPAARGTAEGDRALLDAVALALDASIAAGPPPAGPRPRWVTARRRWAVWSFLPWLGMTTAILLAALLLDGVAAAGMPSLVLLVAPVVPLIGVAGSWTRYSDPAWELVAGSPRVGLQLLLRRTATALAVVIPLLLVVAGWAGGQSPAYWLLPCLGVVSATLALSQRLGVARAATWVGAGWVLAVLAPSLLTKQTPALLTVSALPAWGALTLAAGVAVLLGNDRFGRLTGPGHP